MVFGRFTRNRTARRPRYIRDGERFDARLSDESGELFEVSASPSVEPVFNRRAFDSLSRKNRVELVFRERFAETFLGTIIFFLSPSLSR